MTFYIVCGALHLLSPHYKVNSEGNTCEFKPTGFRAKNYLRQFFTRKNFPVLPSELRMGLGRSKRSDLRRINQGQKKNQILFKNLGRLL